MFDNPEADQLVDQLDGGGMDPAVKRFDLSRYCWPDLFWWLR